MKRLQASGRYLLFIASFAVIGSILLMSSHAATPTSSVEPENGTISSAAGSISDSTASGSRTIKFGSGGTGTVQTNCALNPSGCGYPDATNTGIPASERSKLKTVPSQVSSGTGWEYDSRGFVAVDGSTAVLKDLDISVSVVIEGGASQNVSIQYVYIYTSGDIAGIDGHQASGSAVINVDHVEINGGKTNPSTIGVWEPNGHFTVTAANIYNTTDAIDYGDNDVLQDSYIHDLWVAPGDHTDGMQEAGGSNITINHNTIDGSNGDNASIFLDADQGNISNVTANNNLILAIPGGSGSHPPIRAGVSSPRTMTNVSFTNNRIYYNNSTTYIFVPDGTHAITFYGEH